MTPLLIPLPGNETFAQGLTRAGGFDLGKLETRRFPDGETYLRHRSELSGRSVALVCTLNDPDPKLMPLLLAAGAARALGARRVGLVAPYLAYMRQDRRFHDGEAVSAMHFANILSREIDWLVTVDPHLHRIHDLGDIYGVPAQALHAGPLMAQWIGAEIPDPLLIGPDEESEQWVSAVAGIIGAPYAVARKTRAGDRRVTVDIPDLRQWTGRTPVLVDDVASSGETLIASVDILRRRGLPAPVCVVVHGIFAGDAHARLLAKGARVASADSIPHASNRIALAPLVAGAVAQLAS